MKHLIFAVLLIVVLGGCDESETTKTINKSQYWDDAIYRSFFANKARVEINGHRGVIKRTYDYSDYIPVFVIEHEPDCPCRKAEK